MIRRLSYGRKQSLTSRWVTVSGDLANPQMGLSDDVIAQMNLAILEVGIESMTDPAGHPIAVTPETVYSLDDKDAEFIITEINRLNPTLGRGDEEASNFPGGPGGGGDNGEHAPI